MTVLRDKGMFPDVLIGTVWKGPNGSHGNPSLIGLDHPPPSAFEFRKLVRENLPGPFAGKLFSGTCLKVYSADEHAIALSRSPILPVESNRNVRHKTFGWAKHPTVELTRRREFIQPSPDESSEKHAPAARVQRFVMRRGWQHYFFAGAPTPNWSRPKVMSW